MMELILSLYNFPKTFIEGSNKLCPSTWQSHSFQNTIYLFNPHSILSTKVLKSEKLEHRYLIRLYSSLSKYIFLLNLQDLQIFQLNYVMITFLSRGFQKCTQFSDLLFFQCFFEKIKLRFFSEK